VLWLPVVILIFVPWIEISIISSICGLRSKSLRGLNITPPLFAPLSPSSVFHLFFCQTRRPKPVWTPTFSKSWEWPLSNAAAVHFLPVVQDVVNPFCLFEQESRAIARKPRDAAVYPNRRIWPPPPKNLRPPKIRRKQFGRSQNNSIASRFFPVVEFYTVKFGTKVIVYSSSRRQDGLRPHEM